MFLDGKMTTIIVVLFSVLITAVVFLAILSLSRPGNVKMAPMNKYFTRDNSVGSRLQTRQRNLFNATVGNSQGITADGKFHVKISLSGAADVDGSRITGAAVNFYDVPSFLSNPKIEVANSSWSSKSSQIVNGKAVFIADGLTSPVVSSQDNFIEVTFDAKNPVDSQMKFSVELTDDNIPARSHQAAFGDVVIKK